eukprot:scaffold10045_cov64-Phaeocystis_antarctica.AAC.4
MPTAVVQRYVRCEMEVMESRTLESTSGATGASRMSSAIWYPSSTIAKSSACHFSSYRPSSPADDGADGVYEQAEHHPVEHHRHRHHAARQRDRKHGADDHVEQIVREEAGDREVRVEGEAEHARVERTVRQVGRGGVGHAAQLLGPTELTSRAAPSFAGGNRRRTGCSGHFTSLYSYVRVRPEFRDGDDPSSEHTRASVLSSTSEVMPGSPTSTISSPTSAMEEALAADSGLTAVLEEAAVKGRCTQRRLREKGRPDLLSDSELATLDLRFAVGDKVRCCVATDDFEEGVVVRRCYREDDWPSGHYAAVRTCTTSIDLSVPNLAHALLLRVARSTKCGWITARLAAAHSSTHHVTTTATSDGRSGARRPSRALGA